MEIGSLGSRVTTHGLEHLAPDLEELAAQEAQRRRSGQEIAKMETELAALKNEVNAIDQEESKAASQLQAAKAASERAESKAMTHIYLIGFQ